MIDQFVSGETLARHDPLWERSGASCAKEYEYWAWHTCGVACLRSVLHDRHGECPSAVPLAKEIAAVGGYRETPQGLKGLIYQPFVDYLGKRWGISAQVRTGHSIASLCQDVGEGNFVMASVHSSIRNAPAPAPHPGGHLVLVYGVHRDSLEFHNPSGHTRQTREAVRMPIRVFARYYAGRGIVIARPNTKGIARDPF